MEITGEKAEKMLLEEGFLPKAEEGAEGYVSGLTVGELSPFSRRAVLERERGEVSAEDSGFPESGTDSPAADFWKGGFSDSVFERKGFSGVFLRRKVRQRGRLPRKMKALILGRRVGLAERRRRLKREFPRREKRKED